MSSYSYSLHQLGNPPASVTRAALAMGNSLRSKAFASPRSTVCTWCPLNFGTAAGILVIDFDTHFGKGLLLVRACSLALRYVDQGNF